MLSSNQLQVHRAENARHLVAILRTMAVAAAFLMVSSCTSSTAPVDSIVGDWRLRTWDGKSLPAMTYGLANGYSEMLLGERFVIDSDGTYTFSRAARFMPEGRNETRTGTGSWKQTATGYSIGAGFVPGRMSSGSLVVQWRGDGKTDWVYASAD